MGSWAERGAATRPSTRSAVGPRAAEASLCHGPARARRVRFPFASPSDPKPDLPKEILL